LLNNINKVGVIGVGKLGLAYALLFENSGVDVIASSYKQEYVNDLSNKKISSLEPGIKHLLKSSSNIEFTINNHRVIDQCDIIYVMVATPSTSQGDYDMSAIYQVAEDFLNHKGNVSDKILIIGSTVNPGTTDRVQRMLADKNVHVVYCPTFVAQGSVLKDIASPHTLSLGTTNVAVAEKCKNLFSKIIADVKSVPIYQMKPLTVEILKIAGNCRATLLISFFNMIGQCLLKNNLQDDLDSAMQYLNFVKKGSVWNFGFGFGGPCYPRDNRSFEHYTKEIGMEYPFSNIVDRFNQSHDTFLAEFLLKQNDANMPFYFEYISYKQGVDIFEESRQYSVCQQLLESKATVFIEDTVFLPQEIKTSLTKKFGDLVKFVSIKDIKESVYKIKF
jgi:UDPglucose 6-dehydrogenase